jgi:hypothetical protein
VRGHSAVVTPKLSFDVRELSASGWWFAEVGLVSKNGHSPGPRGRSVPHAVCARSKMILDPGEPGAIA